MDAEVCPRVFFGPWSVIVQCPSRLPLKLALGLGLLLALGMAQNENAAVSPKLHPWGQFEPGTWKVVASSPKHSTSRNR